MNEIIDVINQAQKLGIKIYSQNGEIKVNIPWPTDRIPSPGLHILSELKKRKAELMVHFVVTSTKLDIQLYMETLRTYGVYLVPDSETGLNIHVPPSNKRCDEMIVQLLDKPLSDNWSAILEYLTAHKSQSPPMPG